MSQIADHLKEIIEQAFILRLSGLEGDEIKVDMPGKTYVVKFNADFNSGIVISQYAFGTLILEEAHFKDYKLDGSYIIKGQDGKNRFVRQYKGGILDGTSIHYSVAGLKLNEKNYSGGIENGEEIVYWKDAEKISQKITWDNGKKVKVINYIYSTQKANSPNLKLTGIETNDGNNNLIEKILCFDGDETKIEYKKQCDPTQHTMTETGYFKSGGVGYVRNYLNGKLHGQLITYHLNGKKQFEANYKDGTLCGGYKAWDEDGDETYAANFLAEHKRIVRLLREEK